MLIGTMFTDHRERAKLDHAAIAVALYSFPLGCWRTCRCPRELAKEDGATRITGAREREDSRSEL